MTYGGNTEIVKYLAEKNPELVNEQSIVLVDDTTTVGGTLGRNSFLQACHGGHTEVVDYLVERNPTMINSAQWARSGYFEDNL